MLEKYNKHPELYGHADYVQRIAGAIGVTLKLNEIVALKDAAYYHDIGKLVVPENILLKPDKLSEDEMNVMKYHPEHGALIMSKHITDKLVLDAIRHHHENFDGTGYPMGLKGEDIPLFARIIAIADVYDALRSDRSYRQGYSHCKAIQIMKENFTGKFDPTLFEIFLDLQLKTDFEYHYLKRCSI